MHRKGDCLSDAVMENFFGLLESELLYLQDLQSREHFKQRPGRIFCVSVFQQSQGSRLGSARTGGLNPLSTELQRQVVRDAHRKA